MAEMNQFDYTSEDLFVEAADVIDTIFEEPEYATKYIEELWDNVKIKLKKNVSITPPQDDLNIVCAVLFYVVATTFRLHWQKYYNTEIVNMLEGIVRKKGQFKDVNEQREVIDNLCIHTESLETWINEYEDSEEWLSDEIETCLASFQNKPQEKISGVLDTELAREIFAKCIKKGWMYETESGYQWEGIPNCRGKIAQLAYICGKIYGFKYSEREGKNIGKEFPDAELCKLFNRESIGKQLVQVYQATNKQKWRTVIDQLFE
ncbi:MAG: hypothetical protein IKQ51_04150 [Bacteroidaceae bacterium]|nr:hypothetical protein [Bacteroidaceae bacterium]